MKLSVFVIPASMIFYHLIIGLRGKRERECVSFNCKKMFNFPVLWPWLMRKRAESVWHHVKKLSCRILCVIEIKALYCFIIPWQMYRNKKKSTNDNNLRSVCPLHCCVICVSADAHYAICIFYKRLMLVIKELLIAQKKIYGILKRDIVQEKNNYHIRHAFF